MKSLLLTISILGVATTMAQNGNGNGNGNGNNTFPTSGYAGIGTNNPNKHLQVNGNVQIDSALTVSETATFTRDASVGEDLIVDGQIYIPNMELTTDTENNIVVIDEVGKEKSLNFTTLVQGAYSSDCMLASLSGSGSSTAPTWQSLSVANSSTGYLYTGSQCPANVGIGTNSPLYRLDVRGTSYFSNGIKLASDYSQSNEAYIQGYKIYTPNDPNLRPWVRFMINENGEDKAAFLVNQNGGLYCTSARVRISDEIPVPDFVFQRGYKLMPLSEVKTYVEENSHLPNIPSEDEIRNDGLSLEQMQMKLLEKIEELTLYVIQLEESKREQDKKIEALELEIRKNR